jgi:S-formylglutathione hydrolase FrmB
LPLIVVMPDGFRGFYTDNHQGPPFARHLGEELPQFIERNFPARPERSARFVGGLSMGGYGALRLALGYPDRFASATSHSGALVHQASAEVRRDGPLAADEYARIFGPAPVGTSHDLVYLTERAMKAGNLPRLRIDCGTEDGLLSANRNFHAELQRLGAPHEYEEFPGGHTWDYWDEHVRDAIKFHMPK